ncbi:MAG TPA: hypothetical protein HA340_05180 [Candidatus Thalassarchaeaceae archaeon]|nr:hypothetical protein [Candidatus Thalassarchaeaceae archaeon]DAC49492.1 MAG TPA: hypothetical protein D7H97_05150 [Candidatus Poseidoniales archaeon]HIH83320.1 hypothetical protein [Candidatus Thalassarchaeaceae archaeon]
MKISTTLRVRVERWPMIWPERKELLESLRDPTIIEFNQRRWREIIRRRRPWVFSADAAKASWSREGRSEELKEWLGRLEIIDESMTPHANDVVNAIEHAAPKSQIEDVVLALEHRQLRRTQILEDMITHLREERGWDLTKLEGNLQQRYTEVSRIQEMDATLGKIEENIYEVISIFDNESSINLLEKAKLAQRMEDSNRLDELQQQTEDMSSDYNKRLLEITKWLENLSTRGLHITAPDNPQPSDLLELEKRVEGVEKNAKKLADAWVRLDELLNLFPEHAGTAVALQGQVERIEQVEELLSLLEEYRDEREQRSRSRLASWKEAGFMVKALESLLENAPRSGWLAIDEHAKKIQVCKEILATIDTIDVSYSGIEDVNEWRRLLSRVEVNNDDYDTIRDGIAKQLRRNRWHREKLDESRIAMATIWPANTNPFHLSLAEYEEHIINLQSGQGTSSFNIDSREDRLMLATMAELDMWRQDGWDVSMLDALAERDHVELWVQLPAIRTAVSEYAKLKERLERLPLGRDKNLLNEVRDNSAKPDQLARLSESIPEMAKHLAALPENNDISPTLFSPSPPQVFAKLHPLKPILIPVVEISEPSEIIEESSDIESNIDYRNMEHLTSTNSNNTSDSTWISVREKVGGPLDDSPRDVRVQRLVRLIDILRPSEGKIDGDALALLRRLEAVGDELLKWTVQRLERRHCPSDGNLLDASKRLAAKFDEIPGPGFDLPRQLDTVNLPRTDDLQAIMNEVKLLEKTTYLPLAGSKDAVKALS